jgi:hypothetical protein
MGLMKAVHGRKVLARAARAKDSRLAGAADADYHWGNRA